MLTSWFYQKLPLFSFVLRKVMICGRHEMASVRDIKINEALLVLCLAYYVEFNIAEIETLWLSRISTYGHAFHKYILRIFRNGCRDAYYAVICIYCCVTDNV